VQKEQAIASVGQTYSCPTNRLGKISLNCYVMLSSPTHVYTTLQLIIIIIIINIRLFIRNLDDMTASSFTNR